MTGDESFPRLRARTQRFTLGEPRTVTVNADGTRVLFLRAAAGDDPRTGLWALDLPGGAERALVDPVGDADLTAAELARRERAREGATGVVSYAADAAGRHVAVVMGGRLHLVDADAGTTRELPVVPGCFAPRPDPTGTLVAYVSDRSLRVVAVDGTGDRRLAGEDDPDVVWGRAEFVAAEEMDRARGFWWAPDGGSLLVERYDESPVARWWIADPAHPETPPAAVRYPAAGTVDADVSLWLVALDGARREVRWDRGSTPYLGRVSWTAAGPPLLQVLSRDQRTAQVLAVDVATGATSLLHEDHDGRWVELFPGVPAWLGGDVVRIVDEPDARRLVVGATAVSPPEVHVRGVSAVTADAVLVTASTGDPSQVRLGRWSRADGLQWLDPAPGVQGGTAGGPTTVVATAGLDSDGTRWTVIRGGEQHRLTSYAATPPLQPRVRLLRLGRRELSAGLLLPRDHTPGRRLPVVMDPYGGPHAQRVLATRRSWLEPQWLADQGFAVLVVDGRGTPGRSPDWERAVFRDVAGPVLADQVDALHAAAELEPDLDLSRVGIRGWSFGGWLAALAVLRRPDVFHAAVAGAPVTDWALYDTFYTERYLGTPQSDPAAYQQCSLLPDAASLQRPLLLIHGLADDNVVAAHSLRLSQRLTESGRPHSVLPLTGVTHMTPQEAVAENLLLLQVEFLTQHLGSGPGGSGGR